MCKTREGTVAGHGSSTTVPMRRPGELVEPPASQFVSLGAALDNLLWKLERGMNEDAITKP